MWTVREENAKVTEWYGNHDWKFQRGANLRTELHGQFHIGLISKSVTMWSQGQSKQELQQTEDRD